MTNMDSKTITVIIALVAIITALFIKYNPKLDLVKSYNRHILFLWYNKEGKRDYIILFKI